MPQSARCGALTPQVSLSPEARVLLLMPAQSHGFAVAEECCDRHPTNQAGGEHRDVRRILDDESLAGVRAVDRRLRMHRHARLVDDGDYTAAIVLIGRLCRCWGAVADLLIPVSPSGPMPSPYDRLIYHSEIDSVTSLPAVEAAASGLSGIGPVQEYPVLLVAASRRRDRYRSIVATSVPVDSPWHLAYAAGLGLLPPDGDHDLLERVLANPELTIDEMLPIERQYCSEPGLDDLLSRLGSPTAVAASLLTLSPRPLRSTVHATDGWLTEPATLARQKGNGIVVLYRPGDVADLCLLWNLRSLHGWPAALPIGMPWPENDREATDALVGQLALLAGRTELYSGAMSFGLVVVSASIPSRELADLIDKVQARDVRNVEWGEPAQFLVPAYAPARMTSETLLFTDGAALIPSRVEGDREWLAVAAQTPMRPPLRLSVTLRGGPLPTGRTLFGDLYKGPRYLGGAYTTDGSRDELRQAIWPHKWTLLRAVAADFGLRVEPSPSGRSAMALLSLFQDIQEVRWLAHRPLLDLLFRTAASSGMTWFKRRATELAEVAAAAQVDPEYARDEFLTAINSISVSLDLESSDLFSFSDVRQALGNIDAARVWMRWAEARRLIVRGAVIACRRCMAKTWRPLADVTESACPGCGRAIDHPFDTSSLPFRFRLSEPLRRAIENDSIYHVLIMRYLVDLTSREDWLVGAHPGVDIYDSADNQIGEADVLLLFSDATTLPIEVKRHASAFKTGDITRLERIADKLSSVGTVLGCGDDHAAAAAQIESLAQDEPRPRRLVTSDQWLAPHARPVIDRPVGDESYWRGGDDEGSPSDAFDRRFTSDLISFDPLHQISHDPIAKQLELE